LPSLGGTKKTEENRNHNTSRGGPPHGRADFCFQIERTNTDAELRKIMSFPRGTKRVRRAMCPLLYTGGKAEKRPNGLRGLKNGRWIGNNRRVGREGNIVIFLLGLSSVENNGTYGNENGKKSLTYRIGEKNNVLLAGGGGTGIRSLQIGAKRERGPKKELLRKELS